MKPMSHDECGVCNIPSFERNNYFYGKLMTVRDFCQEQTYFNEKRWLLNRMVLGWGVVCGLDVCAEGDNIVVKPGLAIDCCGRELLVCQNWEKPLAELKMAYQPDCPITEPYEQELVICLQYYECTTEPVRLPPIVCDQKEMTEYNRVRDSYKIEVKKLADVVIPEPHGDCCPLMESKGKENPDAYRLHPYLCNRLRQGCPACEHGHCLVLAKLVISYKPAESVAPYQGDPRTQHPVLTAELCSLDPCYRRKLVYGNTLLYELIRCYHGDLPHIVGTSWDQYVNAQHEMSFEDFRNIIPEFTVYFDMPMEAATLNKHSFLITVITADDDTGYREPHYVPATDIRLGEDGKTAIFQVDEVWITDTFGARSRIRRHGGDIEIMLRGSLILSQRQEDGTSGKALDGDFIGRQYPTGNGVQGGDFISYFSVLPEDTDAEPVQENPYTA
jgi:hypothetical protein